MKKFILAIITILLLATLTGCIIDRARESKHRIYPMSGEVIGINREDDIVTFENPNGHKFSFYGCEDWGEGDKLAVIMDDNGTPTIYDDIVVMAYYQG